MRQTRPIHFRLLPLASSRLYFAGGEGRRVGGCLRIKDIFLLNFLVIGNALTDFKALEMALAIFPDNVAIYFLVEVPRQRISLGRPQLTKSL